MASFFVFIVNGFFILPILGLMLVSLSQKYLPEIVQGFIVFLLFGLYLYIIYLKFPEVLEYMFDKEIIEVDGKSIRIEKSGFLGIKSKRVYLVENIKGIATSFSLTSQIDFLNRLPIVSSNLGAFVIWRDRIIKPFHNFGQGVSQTDAQDIVDAIYKRFPRYIYSGNS